MKNESIVICGGGIAGMASALGLKKAGFTVQILAPAYTPYAVAAQQYHPRVYALSAVSQAFLADLGVWALMQSDRITVVEGMELYGDGDGFVQLDAWQNAQSNLTWIVESSELERVLYQALQVYSVPWQQDFFESFSSDGVRSQKGQLIPADLVIGADGANSKVRAAAQIQHQKRDYQHHGVVAHLQAELPHQNMAYQWFTGDAVLALLPMPDTDQGPQVSMVWSVQAHQANEFMALEPEAQSAYLSSLLNALTQSRLGKLHLRSPAFAFPLTLEKSQMVAPKVALVGDAAHRVHPLAGQGLNLGLGDIEELIRVLQTKASYQSVGDSTVLARYKRARLEPVMAMRWVTHSLHQLFALPGAPAAFVRNIGMNVVNKLPFIKRQLINGAAGKKTGFF